MPESHQPAPHDPLRSAFHRAGADGQARAEPASLDEIAVRGDRLRKRRLLTQVAAVTLFFAGMGITIAALVPGHQGEPPATPPSVSDSSLLPSTSAPSFPSSFTWPVPTTDTSGPAATSTTSPPLGTNLAPNGIPTTQLP